MSFNCNGIRSSSRKGLVDYLKNQNPTILCLQETKAPKEILDSFPYGKFKSYCLASKAGYSGVATASQKKPISEVLGYGGGIFETEGRSLLWEMESFFLWNLYFPSGTSGEERQREKMKFLLDLEKPLRDLKKEGKPLVLCGDINIAHSEKDIHNPKGNAKSSGFLPEEREWVDHFLRQGFSDTFRELHPEAKEYSWWSYRFQSRSNNKGWRIDYFFVDQSLLPKVRKAWIDSTFVGSDHAPIYLELEEFE